MTKQEGEALLEKFREMAEEREKRQASSHPCPSCGHCPHCGRGCGYAAPWAVPFQPYRYVPYPYYQPSVWMGTAHDPHIGTYTAGQTFSGTAGLTVGQGFSISGNTQ